MTFVHKKQTKQKKTFLYLVKKNDYEKNDYSDIEQQVKKITAIKQQ